MAAEATGVSVGAYLKSLGHGATALGYVTSSGLAGAAVSMLLATLSGDRVGRRQSLVLLSALAALAGSVVLLPLSASLSPFGSRSAGLRHLKSLSDGNE